jgi:hypothetical protein
MTDNVVHMRDFKRKEEQEAEVRRFADRLVDQIRACELPLVWPSFHHAPDKDPA